MTRLKLFFLDKVPKASENIRKKDGGPDRPVSNNRFSSVALKKLAMKARESNTVISCFNMQSNKILI